MKHYLEYFHNLKAMLFDVDGVLTDGKISFTVNGERIKTLYARDINALEIAIKKGMTIGLITKGRSLQLKQSFHDIGIKHIYAEVNQKIDAYENFKKIKNLTDQQISYMGDDIPDIEVLKKVAVPMCPSDATHEVTELCNYISPFKGGNGAVRDVIEKVLRSKKIWY